MQTVKEEIMIDLIGFKNNSEFLPKDFDTFDSKQKLRQLFYI